MAFTPNATQLEIIRIANQPDTDNLLVFGASRNGKSTGIVVVMVQRALLFPGIKQGVFRATLNSCNRTLGPSRGTFPEIMKKMFGPDIFKNGEVEVFKSESRMVFKNGSEIIFEGLDDDRIENVLGMEFGTTWFSECNHGRDYEVIQKLQTRMNDSQPMMNAGQPVLDSAGKPVMSRPLMIFDCNPRVESDWDYQAFHLKIDPITKKPLHDADRWKSIWVPANDNVANQADGYLEKLKARFAHSPKMFARFIEGRYSKDNPDAMFQASFIKHRGFADKQFVKIYVGVDPSMSDNRASDETGIIVVGLTTQGEVFVLEDASTRGAPDVWAKAVVSAYERWGADRIIAERNQGGLLVQTTIDSYATTKPRIKLVFASRGKTARAEPVAIEYAKNHGRQEGEAMRIYHAEDFTELEAQMLDFETWVKTPTKSPDRVDALVWAITELLQLHGGRKGGVQSSYSGGAYRV